MRVLGGTIIFVDQLVGVNMEFFNPDDSEIQQIEDDSKFCLIKSDQQVKCQPMLQQMLITGAFSDVTLVCDDQKQLKAHKSVLSACSPMLREILEINGNDSSFIFVRSIDFNALKSVMQYIYLGKAIFPKESVIEFLNVAKILVISDLLKKIKFEEGKDANNEQKIADNESRDKEAKEACNDIDPTDKRFYNNSINGQAAKSKLRKRKVIASCKECNMYFSGVSNFEAHNKSVHVNAAEYCSIIDTEKGKIFECKLCSYPYKKFSRLTQHYRNKHKGEGYHYCQYCDYKSSLKCHLRSHIKNKHEKVKEPLEVKKSQTAFPCMTCNFEATEATGLTEHMKIVHHIVRCTLCNKVFDDETLMLEHVQTVHWNVSVRTK